MTRTAVAAEFAGTGLFLYVVVGSGLVVGRVGSDAVAALFFHAIAVGLALAVLIVLFASISGAHFNPAVTMAMWRRGKTDGPVVIPYVVAQMIGACVGVALAHASFGAPVLEVGGTARSGWGLAIAELIGTLTLVLLILVLLDQNRENWVGPAVGAWVATMIFSTASTGFLNPAVTFARTLTNSYAGISLGSVPGLVAAQLAGGLLAALVSVRLIPPLDMKGA